jgi:hypothetical protein
MQSTDIPAHENRSSDNDDRIRDFFSRHGGASSRTARNENQDSNLRGWSEVYAADGYTLRCDWSMLGSKEELKFVEIPPGGPSAQGPN